jgi:hypothetical protein
VSNRRKARRPLPPRQPPQRLQEMARQSACPDCSSEVVLLHQRGGDGWDWMCEVRHDDGCPQLAWRERTGAGPSFALIGRDGSQVPPEAVSKMMALLTEHGLVPGRVAVSASGEMPPAPGWQEREAIEQAVARMRKQPTPGSRNALFGSLADKATAAGYTTHRNPGRTFDGTVLAKWMRSICPDGMTMPHCEHAVPGQPALLSTDDPHPMIRCGPCMLALAGMADDRVCHLCGREPDGFREFMVEGTGQLVITGNACRECFADIFRGRPSPAASP